MYSLTSTLSTAANALNADTGAISVVNNNIVNANTPGYSRQLVNLSPAVLNSGGTLQNNGVTLGMYSSVRDSVLQLAVLQKTSDLASSNAQSATWAPVESAFAGTDTGLGAAISTFFSDMSALSTSPKDSAIRQTAFAAGSQLTNAFHQSASALSTGTATANQNIGSAVAQINQLALQVASLDGQLSQVGTDQDGGALKDQRDEATRQLAQLTGLTVINTESTPTLALSNGTPLVMGGTAYALKLGTDANGQTEIYDHQGVDITSQVEGGSLGGLLTMRDNTLPSLQQSLDQLATQFASAMNTAQGSGFDLNGAQGAVMFALPQGQANAAATISFALQSSSGIAISSDGSSGSSGNLSKFLSVQSTLLPSGMTPTDAYANLVQTIGSGSSGARSAATATTASLNQLLSQQSSESGVSVDEETTNLLRYQQAYSAAAQVISTINSLFSTLMNIGMVTG